jgi:hypothetical protein
VKERWNRPRETQAQQQQQRKRYLRNSRRETIARVLLQIDRRRLYIDGGARDAMESQRSDAQLPEGKLSLRADNP